VDEQKRTVVPIIAKTNINPDRIGFDMKISVALIAAAVVITGCASPPTHVLDPAAVQVMPNDCANRAATLRWLETHAALPRQSLESQQQYEQNRAYIKKQIWSVRYNCQPV
jgi:hypothetical protein